MKMLRITLEGRIYDVGVEVLDDAVSTLPQSNYATAVQTPLVTVTSSATLPLTPPIAAAEGCRVVASPMAGHVFKCLVKPGEVVEENQVLIVLDAMKMETPIVAPLAGRVRTVMVKEGDAVDDGQSLVQIEGLPQ